jgi:hypothetical protein
VFVSLIDPESIKEKTGYLPKIELTRDERNSLFQGGLIVIGFQIILVYLIAYYYTKNN